MSSIKGSCLCGSVEYESSSEPLMVAACHCTHCQKQSGSAFSMNIGVPMSSVTISGGSLMTYEDMGASGKSVLRKFCGKCGSPILSDIAATDGLCFIKAGSLDDSSWLQVGMEIWCDSKATWSVIGDEIPKMPGNPPLA